MAETVICPFCFHEYDPEKYGTVCPLCNHNEATGTFEDMKGEDDGEENG